MGESQGWIKALGGIALRFGGLDVMRRFYQRVVGLELMLRSDRACFFRLAPGRLVVAGDSAGGDLVLGLALSLRDSQAPLPSLAICLAPWTDVANSGASMTGNEKYDWVERRMVMKWAQWLCHGADPRSPWISPIHADLRGLSPIYVQAGDAEIFYDMIRAFVGRAKEQGVEVTLDVWKHMNQKFQTAFS